MTSTSDISPEVAESLARAALAEITPSETVGAFVDRTAADDGVVTLRFEMTQNAYRGWFWTVALVAVEGQEPTVLEAELLPGDDALLAPDWVPWSQRLEEYKAQQAEAERKAAEESHGAGDDEYGDDDDDDHDSAYLHAGDVDGVDIDEYGDDDDDEYDADFDAEDGDGSDDDSYENEESDDGA